MSKLSSLFGGGSGSSDDNASLDALKYSAPKEPKAGGAKALDTNLTQNVNIITPKPAGATAPAPATGSSTSQNQSQIIASAAVRLYKVSPATGSFEPHEGGAMLGCVLMGVGLNFQILVYNGQKIPQATVSLTPGFLFSARDLYMSFSDGIGNQWAILFEQHKIMHTYLRSLVASLSHIAMYHETSIPFIRALASLSASAASGEDQPLSVGMVAGVYYSIWELGGPTDSPNTILSGPCYKELASPNDVWKVKIGGEDDLVGGMSDALIGCKKGDKVWVGLPPNKASLGTMNFSDRLRATSWIFMEIEVVKVKNSDDKKKKDKKSKSKESNFGSNDDSHEQALTIVEDQQARSYYLDTNKVNAPAPAPAPAPTSFNNPTPANPTQQQMYNNNTNNNTNNNNTNPYGNEQWGGMSSQHIIQLQQNLVNIQNSVMQLHGKVDGLGMQLTTSSSMQMGMNPMGLNTNNMQMGMQMGISPMQQQMQMQLMQQLLYPQYMSGLPKPSTGPRGTPIRVKSEELISTIESIVNDYEACINENSGAGKDAKETIVKLEEKVENLQARNEKLMIEKSALLEKQAEMLQLGIIFYYHKQSLIIIIIIISLGADTSSKTFAMQQDAENLRREKMQLEVRINDLSNALERSLNSSRTSDEDRTKISQLEREILSLSALERSAQEDNNRLKHLLDEEQNNSKKVFEDFNSEKLKYTELLEEVASLQNKIEEAKLREDIVPPPAPVDLNDAEIQNYVNSRISEEVDNIQSKVIDAENIIASLKQENERLQLELVATKESSSSASPAASAEELKSIMQDVYMKACEIFVSSDEDDSSSYTSQDVIKRLKSVLKHVTNERNSK